MSFFVIKSKRLYVFQSEEENVERVMGNETKQETYLAAACSLTVLVLVSMLLVLINLMQTFLLSNLFSFVIWVKGT